jgi:hypothetical protein
MIHDWQPTAGSEIAPRQETIRDATRPQGTTRARRREVADTARLRGQCPSRQPHSGLRLNDDLDDHVHNHLMVTGDRASLKIRVGRLGVRQQLGDVDQIELPEDPPNRIHSWHLFPIRLNLDRLDVDRNAFVDLLRVNGVKD